MPAVPQDDHTIPRGALTLATAPPATHPATAASRDPEFSDLAAAARPHRPAAALSAPITREAAP